MKIILGVAAIAIVASLISWWLAFGILIGLGFAAVMFLLSILKLF